MGCVEAGIVRMRKQAHGQLSTVNQVPHFPASTTYCTEQEPFFQQCFCLIFFYKIAGGYLILSGAAYLQILLFLKCF